MVSHFGADEDERESAQRVRALRRQAALGALLALLVVIEHYMPLGVYAQWVTWPQTWVAGVLVLDTLVRPLLAWLVPARITIDFGKREK